MTTIGTTTWRIILSTTIALANGYDNSPDGDKMYVLASDVDLDWKFGYKITTLYGGSSYSDKTGMRTQSFAVKKGILLNTDINKCTEVFINKAHQAGVDPLYAFIILTKPGSSEGGATQKATVYKSFEDDVNDIVWHLRGYLKKPKISIGAGELYRISFNFVECWL